jgi:hypothetical protein
VQDESENIENEKNAGLDGVLNAIPSQTLFDETLDWVQVSIKKYN